MDSSGDSGLNIELLIARIKEQQELNGRLKDDRDKLKEQGDVLQEYKQEIKYSPSDFKRNEMNISNALSSFSSIQFGSSNGTTTQKCIQATIKEEEHDDIFFPIYTAEKMTFNSISTCRGCGWMFKRNRTCHEKSYYIHCIAECPSYQNLNLITKCDRCQKLFINAAAKGRHFCNRIIPMYEGKQIAIANGAAYSSFKLIPCKGCGKEFKKFINKNGFKHLEKDYYTHCIRDCKDYQKLALAKVCVGCDKWFLNQTAVSNHKCHIQSKDRTMVTNRDKRVFRGKEVTKPKWMPMNIFKLSACDPRISKPREPKMCPGCKNMIQGGRISRSVSSYNYLVHCIEECDEYKKLNLIRKCKQCKFKFLNPTSYTFHLKTHGVNKE